VHDGRSQQLGVVDGIPETLVEVGEPLDRQQRTDL